MTEAKSIDVMPSLEDRDSTAFGVVSFSLLAWLSLSALKAACTISNTKNTADIGALNPADTPAAAPHDKINFCSVFDKSNFSLMSSVPKMTRDVDIPTSTAGPSGPSEQPVPRVAYITNGMRTLLIQQVFIIETEAEWHVEQSNNSRT